MALSGSLNFLTASEVGSFELVNNSNARNYGGPEHFCAPFFFIPNDFVGLNTNIYEPITASSNTLGYPLRNSQGFKDDLATRKTYVYRGGLPDLASATNDFAGYTKVLNGLLHHRNGPYQHPSWKQIRGGEHPIARSLRLNNTMSFDMHESGKFMNAKQIEKRRKLNRIFLEDSTHEEINNHFKEKNNININLAKLAETGKINLGPTIKRFYEPSVVVKHKPFVFDFTSQGLFGVSPGKARGTLTNNMVYFENTTLNDNMKILGPIRRPEEKYSYEIENGRLRTAPNRTSHQARGHQYYGVFEAAKFTGATNFVYSQMIFPKSINVFRPFKLGRAEYEEAPGLGINGYDRTINRSFWKTDQGPSLNCPTPSGPTVTPPTCFAAPYKNGDSPYPLLQTASSDGTTRLRTDQVALNSQNFVQNTNLRKDFIDGVTDGAAGKPGVVTRENMLIGSHYGVGTSPGGTPNSALTARDWNANIRYIQNGVIAEMGIMTTTGSYSFSKIQITTAAVQKTDWNTSYFLFVGATAVGSAQVYKVQFDSTTATDVTVGAIDGGTGYRLISIGTSDITDGSGAAHGLATKIVDAFNAQNKADWSNQFRAELLPSMTTSANKDIVVWHNAFKASLLDNVVLEAVQASPSAVDNLAGGTAFKVLSKFDDGNMLGGIPNAEPRGAFVNNETYNPYPISLLSRWPLDPRQDLFPTVLTRGRDIFTANPFPFMTSSHGGHGLQIGLTPHRMKEWDAAAATAPATPTAAWPNQANIPVKPTKAVVFGQGPHNTLAGVDNHSAGQMAAYPEVTASYLQLTHLMTGTAGELVYSTKPTIFYHSAVTLDASKTSLRRANPAGYREMKASLQYNRHTFPYNTPFYLTDKIRKRQPFFDSYEQFSHNLKYLSRDYSIVPEYRISENIEYYYERYFKGILTHDLYEDDMVQDNPTREKVRKHLRRIDLEGYKKETTNLNMFSIIGHSPVSSSSPNLTSFSGSVKSRKTLLFNPLENEVTGSDEKFFDNPVLHFSQVKEPLEFFKKFSHTDDLIDFSQIVDKPFVNGKNTIPSKIRFVVKSLKKLLPYKNFYPMTKTVDVGNKFKNFIYDYLTSMPATSTTIEHSMRSNFTSSIDYIKPGLLQAFLEPYFAPGILYNSIKSGIAVDYPIYTKSPAYFAPLQYLSGAIAGPGVDQIDGIELSQRHDIIFNPETIESFAGDSALGGGGLHFLGKRFDKSISSSFNYGGFYMMGAMRGIPAILNRAPTHRLPFESLYKTNYLDFFRTNLLHLTTDFLDLDINGPSSGAMSYDVVGSQGGHHPGAAFVPGGPRALLTHRPSNMDNAGKALYESSINNYLCETMNFFLKDQGSSGIKLPIVTSKRKSAEDMGFVNGHTYYMEVSLRMGLDHVSCEGPRDAGAGGGGIEHNRYTTGPTSMRGYIYGPPIEVVQMSGTKTVTSFPASTDPETNKFNGMTEPYISSYRLGSPLVATLEEGISGKRHVNRGDGHFESYFGANLQDPAYQAYTPPYFYGNSSIILTYKAENLTQPNVPLNPTAYEVMGEARSRAFYFEEYVTGSLRTRGTSSVHDSLCKFVPGTSSIAGQGNVRMKIDSGIDLFGGEGAGANVVTIYSNKGAGNTTITEHLCYFAPKWTCPVLDFSSSFSALTDYTIPDKDNPSVGVTTTVVTNSFHSTRTGRGLWGGYGTDPYDSNAMSIVTDKSNISNNPSLTFDKGIYLSVKFPFYGEQTKQEGVSFQSDVQQTSENGFYTKRSTTLDEGNIKLTGSLINELGFEERSYEIGRFAQGKRVSEALVVIPYFERPFEILAATKTKLKTTNEVAPDGWDILEEEYSHDVPGGEIYRTREVIPGKHFLPIQRTLFENILSMNLLSKKHSIRKLVEDMDYVGFESHESYDAAARTDVFKMIDLITGDESKGVAGYELPPELDFVHYKKLPFQMFVIPMEHTLRKQELIDIYQGIMPNSSLRAKKDKEQFVIKPSSTEEMPFSWMPVCVDEDGLETSFSSIAPQNFLSPAAIVEQQSGQFGGWMHESTAVWMTNSQDFYKNLKFMVFKVKERAHKDYERYRKKQIARRVEQVVFQDVGNTEKVDFDKGQIIDSNIKVSERFGYNWPYDDFSLVESLKIEVDITVEE